MVALPGLCGFFGLWCLHCWVWWVEIWCWWAVGWSWDGLWVVVTVASLCHVHLHACLARFQVHQDAYRKSETIKLFHSPEMSPHNVFKPIICEHQQMVIKLFKISWIDSEVSILRMADQIYRGGVREDFAARMKITGMNTTSDWQHQILKSDDTIFEKWRHNIWKVTKVWKICNNVPSYWGQMVPGCHGGGWLQCPLPAGCFGSLTQFSCAWLISVGPGCDGWSFCGSCTFWAFLLWMIFPCFCIYQHQCSLLCYQPVALLAFAYLKILWVV